MKTQTRNITIAVILTILLVILFFKKKQHDSSNLLLVSNPDDKNKLFINDTKAVFSTSGGNRISSTTPESPNTGYMEIYLQLQNNSSQPQNITLFDVVDKYNQQATNGTTFIYDLTAELAQAAIFSNTEVVVIAQPNINSPYQVYSYDTLSPVLTITDAINGLNNLGIGTFTNPSGNLVSYTSTTYFLSNISITNVFTALVASNVSYTQAASLIYNSSFQSNGVGTVTPIPSSNSFWNNIPANLVSGPMNRNAVWNNGSIPLLEYIGTDISLFMPQAGTVYIGMGMDNSGRFWVNGQLILNMDYTAMQASIVAQYPVYSGIVPRDVPLKFWNIFPISLPAGYSSVFVQNENTGFGGAIAIEVYNNTAAEIAAATSYGGLNIMYRTSTIVGTNALY